MSRRRAKQVAAVAGIFLASYLVMLLALFPASLAWRLAEPMLDPSLALEVGTVSGRVWSGEAHGIRIDGNEMGSLAWRWLPAATIRGQLGLAVQWTSGREHLVAELGLARDRATARAVRGELDASRVQALFDVPVLLGGNVHLDFQRIDWRADSDFSTAAGALAWTDAAAGLPQPIPLGHYRAELGSFEGSLAVQIESAPDSPLSATGSAAWRPPETVRVDLRLATGNTGGQSLERVLATLGERRPDGSRRLLIEHP